MFVEVGATREGGGIFLSFFLFIFVVTLKQMGEWLGGNENDEEGRRQRRQTTVKK